MASGRVMGARRYRCCIDPRLNCTSTALSPSVIDLGYTGNPARFVADPTIAQQAYGTDEPYIYQHEVKAWGKPIAYQLLADVGYNIYPDALSVRTGDIRPLAACLRRLVPIVQQAGLDYVRDPGPTNQLIAPLLAGTGASVKPGLTAADIATDQFLDPTIRLLNN
jgi:hypothetical protein